MIGLEIMIIILLVVILFIFLTGHIYVVAQRIEHPIPLQNEPKYHIVKNRANYAPKNKLEKKTKTNGCDGTRYGCCPYSEIPKLNEIGTNCRFHN